MANLYAFDVVSGICAIVFTLFGIRLLFLLDADQSLKVNMALFACGMFVFTLNVAAALAAFCRECTVRRYFGYLLTYTGKALHFMLMGFYTYQKICVGKGVGDCFEVSRVFDRALIVASFVGVVVGIILLVLGCVGQTSEHKCGIDGGTRLPLGFLNVAACVASCGMLFYGGFWISQTFGAMQLDLFMGLGVFAELFFICVAGFFSALSSVRISSTVKDMMGFLYNDLGRGMFYICMGFYLVAANQDKGTALFDTISWICGIVAIFVGIVYVVQYLYESACLRRA